MTALEYLMEMVDGPRSTGGAGDDYADVPVLH